MSNAAQAYARVAQTTSSLREIEAQALMKAAHQLQVVMNDVGGSNDDFDAALLFNRKLWSLLLSAVTSDRCLQPLEVRQNIANIGIFVMMRMFDLRQDPQREGLKALIEINRHIAAGLSRQP